MHAASSAAAGIKKHEEQMCIRDRYEEAENCTNISAVIYCEKASHKGIIIGAQGKKLKGIGKAARLDIEPLIGSKVFLELWVKVKENWRENDIAIGNFGYKNDNQ